MLEKKFTLIDHIPNNSEFEKLKKRFCKRRMKDTSTRLSTSTSQRRGIGLKVFPGFEPHPNLAKTPDN
ncbi:Hypothetical predicted protein [Cloeon dipterum]|uniref:Uncharacterized protein n=1 Tax=Cloeon dipterum TaxID=197152 RepID=A0A8S1DML3_9INSE|nr:Hypothetical predicted protein [Cloeon dipterum]